MMYRVRLLRDVLNIGQAGLVADVGREVKGKLIDLGAGKLEAFVPESRMVKPTVVDVRVSARPEGAKDEGQRAKDEERSTKEEKQKQKG